MKRVLLVCDGCDGVFLKYDSEVNNYHLTAFDEAADMAVRCGVFRERPELCRAVLTEETRT